MINDLTEELVKLFELDFLNDYDYAGENTFYINEVNTGCLLLAQKLFERKPELANALLEELKK